MLFALTSRPRGAAAGTLGIKLASIAFPRNQVSPASLGLSGIRFAGFSRKRARLVSPGAAATAEQNQCSCAARACSIAICRSAPLMLMSPALVDGMVDVPASRFLRPVGKSAVLERLRLRRITSAMETAARRRRLFHLWWHPHNFGIDLEENLAFLRGILDYFRTLQERYGMRSMTMGQVADEVLYAHGQGGAADV